MNHQTTQQPNHLKLAEFETTDLDFTRAWLATDETGSGIAMAFGRTESEARQNIAGQLLRAYRWSQLAAWQNAGRTLTEITDQFQKGDLDR